MLLSTLALPSKGWGYTYLGCLSRPFQLVQWKRRLLLDIAVTPAFEHRHIMMMSPFPGMIVRHGAKCLLVERAAGIWEHGHRLAHPHSMRLEPLLPLADLITIILIGKDEIGLHPGYTRTRVDEQI